MQQCHERPFLAQIHQHGAHGAGKLAHLVGRGQRDLGIVVAFGCPTRGRCKLQHRRRDGTRDHIRDTGAEQQTEEACEQNPLPQCREWRQFRIA